jgi:hypothetical protein
MEIRSRTILPMLWRLDQSSFAPVFLLAYHALANRCLPEELDMYANEKSNCIFLAKKVMNPTTLPPA